MKYMVAIFDPVDQTKFLGIIGMSSRMAIPALALAVLSSASPLDVAPYDSLALW